MNVKSRSILAVAATVLAIAAGWTGANEAHACSFNQNDIRLGLFNNNKKSYCKEINRDITVSKVTNSSSVKWVTVQTKGEAGSCDLYLITKNNEWHKKFNIGPFKIGSMDGFQRGVYVGFRLGC